VTPPESESPSQDRIELPEDKTPNFDKKLSPSASAILKFVKAFEEGGQLNVFSADAEFEKLRKMVMSYRGSLHSLLTQRLKEVVALGGVSIITQNDIFQEIVTLWEKNISNLTRSELPFLKHVLKNPGLSLKELSEQSGLSYPQSRRAQKRLTDGGVLKIGGMLNPNRLGLDRVLIILETPSLVLTGPYIQKVLYVDGSPSIVFMVANIPCERTGELIDVVRSLRDASSNVSVWRLSTGMPRFDGTYFSPQKGWELDLLHFRLMLRTGGDALTLSEIPAPRSDSNPSRYTGAEVSVMDALIENLDGTAGDIVQTTSLSESSAFRKRSLLLKEKIILPRARVSIPQLGDRVISLFESDIAGEIQPGFSKLPLTYQSQIQNLENPKEKRVLLSTALPTGSGQDMINIMKDEISKIHRYSVHSVAAGVGTTTKVSSMFDRRTKTWKWDTSRFFDAVSYEVMRNVASESEIPLDLA
jgi:DNA-binding Lrp family transcriptional regulator